MNLLNGVHLPQTLNIDAGALDGDALPNRTATCVSSTIVAPPGFCIKQGLPEDEGVVSSLSRALSCSLRLIYGTLVST